MTVVDYSVLSKVKPEKALLEKVQSRAGRNSAGRITMRHQGGGNKKRYRVVDFKLAKLGTAKVETLEYDPYRTAFIAKVLDTDGERRYILAPHGILVGQELITAENAPLKPGNRLPIGYQIHNVELQPGRGGQLARSAGSSLQVLGNAEGLTDLKMASGEVRRVNWNCYATLGQVSNTEWNLTVFGKAGRSRWMGIRPTSRAKAMNPRDHKYGGGEGSTQRGTRRPKDIWGNITGGRKTRNRKARSQKFIVSRRPKKSRK
jgi:large subunit ribosomal protein L2